MRLVTHEDRENGSVITGDSLRSDKVDLDDLIADDKFSFRSDLVHFLTERFSVHKLPRDDRPTVTRCKVPAHRATARPARP
jgi:hypothetical protein